jgi:hypothetical protein
MELDGASTASDRLVAPTITYGGTLVLTNLGAVTGTKTYQLFSATTINPGFASVVTQDLAGVTWDLSQLGANGTVTLIGPAGPPTTPTNIVFSLAGGQLSLEWPLNYTGWELQSNAVSVAESASWFAVPDSALTNRVFMTIDPAQANVYYRLRLQTTP